jgi:translation initiation factor 2 beta subunit (eIF-2beta)/eIF-5
MEEKKQHEEFEGKYTLKAQEVEEAVTKFSEEGKNHPDSKVNMEEVEKVVAAFKDVDSNTAVMSMTIVATVLRGPEIRLLINILTKTLTLAALKDLKRMIDKND